MILFLFTLLIFSPLTARAQEIPPLYQIPSADHVLSDTTGKTYLAGSDKGLYRISDYDSAFPLWTEGKVEQIVRVADVASDNAKERWYFRTSQGILYSENLVDFELRNNGLDSFMIKKYDGAETTLVAQVPMLKDLCADPLNPARLVTATASNVYFTDDGGLNWKSLGSMSTATPGIKACAVATMPDGAVAVFMSHTIFGFSYKLPYASAAWRDISKGFKAMQSNFSPDEISDIFPMLRTREDGSQFVEIYVSQAYIPNLYRFDWDGKAAECIYTGAEPSDSIDGMTNVGNALLFSRIEGLGAINVETLQSPGVPANFADWKKSLLCVPGLVNTAWIPKARSGFSEGVLLNELWMLYPGTINTPYAAVANDKKGIYVKAGMVTDKAGIDAHKKIINNNNLNALVIDMKDDYGLLRYDTRDPLVAQKGYVSRYAIDLDNFVSEFKKDDVYLIARIVVFKDKHLAGIEGGKYAVWDNSTKRAWLGIRNRAEAVFDEAGNPTGETRVAYYDENWVDPYNPEVWEYNVAIAKELVARGFDEIQFDYIRFPTDGLNLSDATYRAWSRGMTKESALLSFLLYARENIAAPIGIDIYGANGWYRSGTRTGQDAETLCEYVDVISPMFYPSHFEADFMNREPYADRTYRIYYYGTYRTSVMTRNRAIARPWVQAFKMNVRYDREYYGADYIQKEIFGVRDAANRGYLYWNNVGAYDYLLPDIDDEAAYIGTAPEADAKFRKPAIGSAEKPAHTSGTISVMDSVLGQDAARNESEAQYAPLLYVPFARPR